MERRLNITSQTKREKNTLNASYNSAPTIRLPNGLQNYYYCKNGSMPNPADERLALSAMLISNLSSCLMASITLLSMDFCSRMVSAGKLSCRSVLWSLVFTGCGINYMIRTNLNITIIAMVWNSTAREDEISWENVSSSEVTNFGVMKEPMATEQQYDWNEYQQSQILGAFFWTYWSSQMVGGLLAKLYGTKVVFGFSNAFMCFATFLIPWTASLHIYALITLRMIQGLIGGMAWPSLHAMTAKWIPPAERSKFVTAYMGSSVGAALTYPLCGLIIYYLGWKAVFYITGTIGVLWFTAWWILVYDTPANHPYISEAELMYITNSLSGSVTERKLTIPWCKIITSVPLWILISAHWGCLWGMFTLLTQAPIYFQYIHGWSIRMNGLFSGVPHICRTILALGVSYICDKLLESKKLSYTSVRKLAVAIGTTLQGWLLVALALCGYNSTVAIICLSAAVIVSGAEAPGPLASYCDLSPNFASVVMGIGNMITVMPGFISPAVVGVLTYQNQTSSQWQIIFLIAAAMNIIPGLLYQCYASSEIQPWNTSDAPTAEELQILDPQKTHEMSMEKNAVTSCHNNTNIN